MMHLREYGETISRFVRIYHGTHKKHHRPYRKSTAFFSLVQRIAQKTVVSIRNELMTT